MSVIGLDVGTSRVKAVRFDGSWSEADSCAEGTEVLTGSDGRREQDMQQVWSAAARVIRAVVERSPHPIDYLAITAQGDGTWLVDAAGEPCGPALLWNDSRAAAVTDQWHDDGILAEAFAISGCLGAPGLASAQLRWLREHDPDRLRRARLLLSCGSWIHHQLTGVEVIERSDAANPFCDAATGGYAPALTELFDLDDEQRLFPQIVEGGAAVSPITRSASDATGLPIGTPCVLAPYDVVTATVGAGAVNPGSAVAILGTTLCVTAPSPDPRLEREPAGMTLPFGMAHSWLIAYATLTGTEALDWAARLLGLEDAVAVVTRAADSTGSVPLFVPYLSSAGERAPFLDLHVDAQLRHLTGAHGPADVARGVLDGLTLAVADCLEAAGGAERLVLSGGGARSDLWAQSIADATGATTYRTGASEVGALGAALHGAVALGDFADLAGAAASLGPPLREWQPDGSQERWRERLAEVRTARTGQ